MIPKYLLPEYLFNYIFQVPQPHEDGLFGQLERGLVTLQEGVPGIEEVDILQYLDAKQKQYLNAQQKQYLEYKEDYPNMFRTQGSQDPGDEEEEEEKEAGVAAPKVATEDVEAPATEAIQYSANSKVNHLVLRLRGGGPEEKTKIRQRPVVRSRTATDVVGVAQAIPDQAIPDQHDVGANEDAGTAWVDGPTSDAGVRISREEPSPNLSRRKRVFRPVEYEEEDVAVNSEVKEKCCSECCSETVGLWEQDVKLELRNTFHAASKPESKNKLLKHLQTQKNLGLQESKFHWKGIYLCDRTFAEASGFSVYIIKEVIKAHLRGTHMFVHGNLAQGKFSQGTEQFKIWVRGFLGRYGQNAPDDNVRVVAHWLTVKDIYEMYTQEALEPHIAESTFYQYMKRHFGPKRVDPSEPQVSIRRYSSHSVCDQCLAFNDAKLASKSEEELRMLSQAKMAHLKKTSEARLKMEEIKMEALQFPEDSVVLQIDGMDSKKTETPRLRDRSKKNEKMLRLPSKVQGCIIYSGKYAEKRKVVFYLNHDHYEQGSNMIVTVIFKLIVMYKSDHGKLPRKLRVFADNCWRENKNRFVFAFLATLVKLQVFLEATLDFLIVGHTGNEVDQLFSIITQVLKTENVPTVEDLRSKILSSPIKPKPIVETLLYTWDWKSFIENKLHPLKNHSLYNSFQFLKENDEVHLRYKQLPQSPEYGPATKCIQPFNIQVRLQLMPLWSQYQ